MQRWVQSWRPRTNVFCDFSTPSEVLHLSHKIILPNLKIWCSKMQPLSGNQRPYLLTSLMNMSLVLRLPREIHVCRSSSNVPCLPSFLEMLQKPYVLLTFEEVHNPFRLPRKKTSERPKVLRTRQFFPTSLCGVHFFRLDPASSRSRRSRRSLLPNHTSLIKSHLTQLITAPNHSSTHHSSHVSTHHSSTSRHQLITALLVAGAVHRASWTSCGAHGRRWAAAAFRVAGAVHRASWTSCGARGRRWAAAAFRVAGAVHRASWSNCGARGRRWAAASFHTTHHSFTYHITTSHHNSSQLLTYQLITAPLLTPHPSQLHCSSQLITAPLLTGPLLITSHRSTSHHNSSQLITSQLITLPLLTPHLSHHNFSSQLITTYHIPTHHSSTSHTTSHTSLIASELITAPLLTPDITSPLLTPHFSHLPEVHIKLRYIKAWHVGLSGPFILHFWLGHVLCATKACAFSTSHLPKLLQRWSTLCVLTSKCASRRNSVHFFDSSTSKSCSETVSFYHFLTSKRASRHNCVQLFLSHLATWLRTRRFSQPTFRPSGATNHWKNTVIRDLSYLFAHLHLRSSDSFSSLIFLLLLILLFHPSILSEAWLLNFLRLLCTTKLTQTTSQYYFVLSSQKSTASTTLFCTKYFPVLPSTTLYYTMFRAPASSPNQPHATFMQPLQCVLHCHMADPLVSTHMATEDDNNHVANPHRSATTDSKPPHYYAHPNASKAAWGHRYTVAKKKRQNARKNNASGSGLLPKTSPMQHSCSHYQ